MATQHTPRGVPYPEPADANNVPLFLELLAAWIDANTIDGSNLPDAVTWGTLDGKPDVFPPAAHAHDSRYNTKAEIADFLTAINNALATKAPKASPTLTGTITLGGADTDLVRTRGVELDVDARGRSFTYTNGELTKITETAGATVARTVDLTYDEDGLISTVTETAGGITATTTFTYDGFGQLAGTTRSVA